MLLATSLLPRTAVCLTRIGLENLEMSIDLPDAVSPSGAFRVEAGSGVMSAESDVAHWLNQLGSRFTTTERHCATAASWVYRGVDRLSGRAVAIKLMKDEIAVSRHGFIAEALLLSELEHPGIVRYIAHGELENQGAYLVTEWLEGEDVGSRLARGPLSIGDSLTVIVRAANALGAAHARGIIHLDLKPSNLFLTQGDVAQVRLLDFGISQLTKSASSDPDSGIIAGTPGYMAPEQILGEPVTPATDIFALGSVLYHCLSGRPIFVGDAFAVMTETAFGPPARLSTLISGIPTSLDDLVASMLDFEPSRRPADAASLLDIIARLPQEVTSGIAPSARILLSPKGLTGFERVPITVVLAKLPEGLSEPAQHSHYPNDSNWTRCFQKLSESTWIALPQGKATTFDQTHHAARLAMDVRSHWPNSIVSLATGHAIAQTSSQQLHKIVEAAEDLLVDGQPGQILLDEACALALEHNFAVHRRSPLPAELRFELKEPALTSNTLIRSSVCLGRDLELAQMVELARQSREKPEAWALLLTGPAGIGKSRLLKEFLDRGSGGVRVWSCYSDSMSAGSAFRAITGITQDGIRSESLGSERQPAAAPSIACADPQSPVVRSLHALLARLTGPEKSGTADAPATTQAGSVREIHRIFAATIGLAVESGPLILKLEDIHWVDLASLRAIDYLLATLPDRPLLVVATARPEVHGLYPDLWRARSFRELRLAELKQDEAARLVSLCLSDEVDATARMIIVQRARGNAFLLHELIRAQADGRGNQTSENALGVVQSRLQLFDPEARRVLRAASILGESFTLQGLQRLVGDESSAIDIEHWLDLLQSKDVIVRRCDGTQGGGLFAFAHALVRDAAYGLLTDSDRALGHRLVAQWLEHSAQHDPVVVAQHYERGADSAGAGRCYVRATVEAFQMGDFASSLRCFELARAQKLEQLELGQALTIAAEASRLLGDVLAAKRLSTEALAVLVPNTPLWSQAARTAMIAGLSNYRYRGS
jgi:eukaryotic-like serine/threonine-protein kinase